MGHEYIITLVSPNIKYNTNITSNISRYIRLAWAPQWTPLIKNRGSAGGLKTAQPRVPLPDPWLAMTDCRPAKWPGIIPISCRGFCTWLLNLPHPPTSPAPAIQTTPAPAPPTLNFCFPARSDRYLWFSQKSILFVRFIDPSAWVDLTGGEREQEFRVEGEEKGRG